MVYKYCLELKSVTLFNLFLSEKWKPNCHIQTRKITIFDTVYHYYFLMIQMGQYTYPSLSKKLTFIKAFLFVLDIMGSTPRLAHLDKRHHHLHLRLQVRHPAQRGDLRLGLTNQIRARKRRRGIRVPGKNNYNYNRLEGYPIKNLSTKFCNKIKNMLVNFSLFLTHNQLSYFKLCTL